MDINKDQLDKLVSEITQQAVEALSSLRGDDKPSEKEGKDNGNHSYSNQDVCKTLRQGTIERIATSNRWQACNVLEIAQ